QAAGLECLRVLRIAVHPAVQRRGLGSRVLDEVATHARARGLDYLGTSFSASAELLSFWRGACYRAVRVGARREPSSGAHAVLMLKGLSAAGVDLVAAARRRFHRDFPHRLSDGLADLETDLVVALLQDVPSGFGAGDADDLRELEGFALHWRGYEAAAGALWRFSLGELSQPRLAGMLSPRETQMLVARVLQKQSWAAVARAGELPGRSAVLAELRQAIARLLKDRARADR
ncbi:MAG: GNAT family N-acetyltransferase, partial [Pseudomonadota bacterium]